MGASSPCKVQKLSITLLSCQISRIFILISLLSLLNKSSKEIDQIQDIPTGYRKLGIRHFSNSYSINKHLPESKEK